MAIKIQMFFFFFWDKITLFPKNDRRIHLHSRAIARHSGTFFFAPRNDIYVNGFGLGALDLLCTLLLQSKYGLATSNKYTDTLL